MGWGGWTRSRGVDPAVAGVDPAVAGISRRRPPELGGPGRRRIFTWQSENQSHGNSSNQLALGFPL